MISKEMFLNEMRPVVEEKTLNRWFFSDEFKISKKVIMAYINRVFEFLSFDDIYINVYDVNFEKLIIQDLNDSILNFINPFEEYIFMSNFKSSTRHIPNKERDRLIEFLEIFDFEKLRHILQLTEKNKDKGGRPPYDAVFKYKILFVRSYYDLSDEQTAQKIKSDDSIKCFLGYPKEFPCKSTIHGFREKISKLGLSGVIWDAFKLLTIKEQFISRVSRLVIKL